jgi:hypothetical protein
MFMSGEIKRGRWLAIMAALLLALPIASGATPASAQGSSRTFKETGKTVKGQFLTYWDSHGGLAQQGFPISEEIQEKSDTDGKIYTVQYFERAVFELHNELPTPNKVLLSLLGNFLWKQKYPGGASGQQPNTSPGSVAYPQTGKRLGGKFKTYWDTHGGLAQQGFPVSDEFMEKSDLDGKMYRVQYFERAVFEWHPEKAGTQFEVLLSQLGTFRYKAKYQGGTPAPGGYVDKDARVEPRCGTPGTKFRYYGLGFTPQEALSAWFTAPDGSTVGTARPSFLTPDDGQFYFDIPTDFNWAQGWWAMTWQGDFSGHQSIGYFQIVANAGQCGSGSNPPPPPPPPPSGGCDVSASRDGSAAPTSARPGQTIRVTAWGFTPQEDLSLWFTAPDGSTVGTSRPSFRVPDAGGFYLDVPIDFNFTPGRWAITFQGDYSGHQSVIYFCVTT